MNINDEVIILIGKYKHRRAKIIKIEFNAGARNGWYTVSCEGTQLLYAGEEIRAAI